MYTNFKSRSSNTVNSSSRYNTDKLRDRYYSIGTGLIDEEEFKYGKKFSWLLIQETLIFLIRNQLDSNQIHNDDSKFARQLKKLLRDEEDDRKVQKVIDLSIYLDQQENIKVTKIRILNKTFTI